MADPSTSLMHCKLGRNSGLLSKSKAVEKSNLTYLAHCYARVWDERRETKVNKIIALLTRVTSTIWLVEALKMFWHVNV